MLDRDVGGSDPSGGLHGPGYQSKRRGISRAELGVISCVSLGVFRISDNATSGAHSRRRAPSRLRQVAAPDARGSTLCSLSHARPARPGSARPGPPPTHQPAWPTRACLLSGGPLGRSLMAGCQSSCVAGRCGPSPAGSWSWGQAARPGTTTGCRNRAELLWSVTETEARGSVQTRCRLTT